MLEPLAKTGRDAILSAFVKKYGTPQEYHEEEGTYSWKWRPNRRSVKIYYDSKNHRTTVTYSQDAQ